MQSALKLTTKVLPGKRLEVYVPELTEGEDVELVVSPAAKPAAKSPQFASAWDFLQSFPPVHHTLEQWEIIEREMQEEKDAWDD